MISLGLLPTGASSSDLISSLLPTLYRQASGQSSLQAIPPSTALLSAEKNQTRDVKRTAAQPEVKRAVDAFTQSVRSAKSVDGLLRDRGFLEVFLTANGLGDQTGAGGLARRVLQSDPSDSKSLVNKLSDTRWKATAKTYDFATKGLSIIQDPKVIAKLADAYAEVKWRKSLDETTPGLSKALTFRAQATSVTSVDEILGDPILRDVVTVALGIPKQIAFQSIEAQERAITTRLDITKLKDSHFVEKFAQRYLLAAAAAANPPDATADIATLAVRSAGLVI